MKKKNKKGKERKDKLIGERTCDFRSDVKPVQL
jgi:hypothetical protein